jgi:ribosomal protein S18 acetylase RimI-like enzyme
MREVHMDDAMEMRYYPKRCLRLTDDVPGARQWAVSLDRTMLTYFEVEPLCRFDSHTHESEQITMVLEGVLYFEQGGRVTGVGAGEVIAVPSNAPHAVFTRDAAVKAVDAWSPVMDKYKKSEAIIGQAKTEDAGEILQLQRLAYQSEARIYADCSIPPLTQTLDGLKDDISRQLCLKASIGGRIVGSVRGERNVDTCEIGRLIVHPDFQGRGIGAHLMHEIERAFTGVERFELFTGHKSERNIRLYRKLGYAIFKTVRVSEDLQLVFMEKKA